MHKQNLTVQLDERTIRCAKAAAARRGMSLSGLAAEQIRDLAESDERYDQARQTALAAMDSATGHGGRSWSRDELYDRQEG